MRRALAALVLIVLVVLTGGDGLCCPDGCSDDAKGIAATSGAGDGVCLVCLGATHPPRAVVTLGVPEEMRLMPAVRTPAVAAVTSAPLDHPPRS